MALTRYGKIDFASIMDMDVFLLDYVFNGLKKVVEMEQRATKK